MLDRNGWRLAVCHYGGYEDIDDFYNAFAELLEKSVEEQMKLLDTIKP